MTPIKPKKGLVEGYESEAKEGGRKAFVQTGRRAAPGDAGATWLPQSRQPGDFSNGCSTSKLQPTQRRKAGVPTFSADAQAKH
jgi:hypothetical protein